MEFWDIVRYIKKVGAAEPKKTSYMDYCTYTIGDIKMETHGWTCYTNHLIFVGGVMCASSSQHLSTTQNNFENLHVLQNAIAALQIAA